MTFEVAIFGSFPDVPKLKLSLPFWVICKAGCDVVRLYILQSYCSCTFCKRKTRGETQFWIGLATPCTLSNDNEINSDQTLPFIIFLSPVCCDGSNRLWCQRSLLSPCSLWRHKQTLLGVIRPLTGGKWRTFHRVIERFCFHRYLCFHCIFCVQVFCILFFYEQSDHIVLKLHSF